MTSSYLLSHLPELPRKHSQPRNNNVLFSWVVLYWQNLEHSDIFYLRHKNCPCARNVASSAEKILRAYIALFEYHVESKRSWCLINFWGAARTLFSNALMQIWKLIVICLRLWNNDTGLLKGLKAFDYLWCHQLERVQKKIKISFPTKVKGNWKYRRQHCTTMLSVLLFPFDIWTHKQNFQVWQAMILNMMWTEYFNKILDEGKVVRRMI